MIFYILIGLTIGFYLATTFMMQLVQEAKEDGVNNTYTRNPVISTIVSILLVAITWPIFLPYFFSQSFRSSIQNGFAKAINTEN